MHPQELLPEFDLEMRNTRRALERVPGDRLEYRPHPKSFDLLALAGHVANLPSWIAMTFRTEELDLSQPFDRSEPKTKDDILADLERTSAEARSVLEGLAPEDLDATWTLRTGDEVHFTLPKAAVYRSFAMNHLVHHRAQLIVYLRLLDVPVPGLYGPSADEMEG